MADDSRVRVDAQQQEAGMMSSGMTVSRAVILRPELLGTGLGAGEMVAVAAGLEDFFMSVRH